MNGQESGFLQFGFCKYFIGNLILKWEIVIQINYGIDFGFFNQSLVGIIDYFYKKIIDMFYLFFYIGVFGEGGDIYVNGLSMENCGVEILLIYWNSFLLGFNYSIMGNIVIFKNKIIELLDNVRSVYGGNGMLDDIIGCFCNFIYGYVVDGIFKIQEEVDNLLQQVGKGLGCICYKDFDGDGCIIQDYDCIWIGVSDLDFIYGLNFQVLYKNVDLVFFFQGVYGGDVWDLWIEYSDFWNIQDVNNINYLKGVFNVWFFQNLDFNILVLFICNINDEKCMFMYFFKDGLYLKLRMIELGYIFLESMVKKVMISCLCVYVLVNNVFIIKKWWDSNCFLGFDFEICDFGYVILFIVIVGVNIIF